MKLREGLLTALVSGVRAGQCLLVQHAAHCSPPGDDGGDDGGDGDDERDGDERDGDGDVGRIFNQSC